MQKIQPAPTLKLLFTMDEAAKVLGYGRTTLYKLVNDGILPTVKVGRMRRISLYTLEHYVRTLDQEAEGGKEARQ